jgi:thioredoxin-related protein
MKKLNVVFLSFLFFIGTLLSVSAETLWMDDFAAAKKLAAETGKDILADFTGSDWCPPCMRMEEEVFTQPDFIKNAPKKYVLLRVDFPHKIKLPDRVRLQNQALAERYPFDGVPTFVLMDAKGQAFGRAVGYVEGGPEVFFALLTGLEKQKAELVQLQAAADSATGAAKAKALDVLFAQAEDWGIAYRYAALPAEIETLDKDNALGLHEKYKILGEYSYLLNSWTQNSDFNAAVTQVEALATRATPYPQLQAKILLTEGMIYLNALNDQTKAKRIFQQVLKLGPSTPEGQQASQLLDQLP